MDGLPIFPVSFPWTCTDLDTLACFDQINRDAVLDQDHTAARQQLLACDSLIHCRLALR